jgi:hypothetical protein
VGLDGSDNESAIATAEAKGMVFVSIEVISSGMNPLKGS